MTVSPASSSGSLSSTSSAIDAACDAMTFWLRGLPEWPKHPTNPSGSVSSNYGATILSEADCVLHFARFLNQVGVPWEDQHLEFSPGAWMLSGAPNPPRVDLAIMPRERLLRANLPVATREFAIDAALEFALASNYWKFGSGGPKKIRDKVLADIDKVAAYLDRGLAKSGYVVVIEECDHRFPPGLEERTRTESGVELRILRQEP